MANLAALDPVLMVIAAVHFALGIGAGIWAIIIAISV